MSRPLVLVPQFFGSLVFDRRTSRYYPFDKESTDALMHLRHGRLDHEEWLPFYDQFQRLGFFDLEGEFDADILALTPPAGHLAGPLAVHLEINGSCNLSCFHCFAGELPRNSNPLSLGEMERLFSDLADMGSFRLGLTGGEPLMRPELFDIIDAATERGLHPCITTNGLLITEDIARQFGARELVWLNVSLEGASPETNDRIRGAGTFSRVLEKVRILRRHTRFTIAFTIMTTNAHEIEECAQLAKALGADAAVFRPLYPVGIACEHPDLLPTYARYAEALECLSGDVRAIDAFSPRLREPRQARVVRNDGCGAGNTVCSISVQGQVSPCSFLGTGYDAGSIRDRSFKEIWHSSRALASLRSSPGEAFCGGCRARALAAHGSIHAEDPWFAEYRNHHRQHPMSTVEVRA